MRLVMLIALLAACTDPVGPSRPSRPKRVVDDAPLALDPEMTGALLPRDAGPRAPSHARFEGQSSEDSRLGDPSQCAPCHGDVVASWRTSAHARSSFDNPWYRATVDSIRDDRGNEASRFCAGCHDPVLLADGAMDADVLPDDPRAHAGITCLVCHSTQQTTSDGNGSYSLRIEDAAIPDPASDAQVAEHVARMTPPPLRTAGLCGTCHRSFLGAELGSPNHLSGIDDIGHWKQSAYAGAHAARAETEAIEARDCVGCHMLPIDAVTGDMAATDGRVSSHRVMASHTALGAQVGVEGSLLEGAASIDVAAVEVDGAWFRPAERAPMGERMVFDVVVRNTTVGHSFPGGTRDLQDTWIEVELVDAAGRVVAEAGTEHATRDDETAFRMRSVIVDEDGHPEDEHRVHRFVAALYDRTLRPRDALVVRYEVALDDVMGPLTVRARLRHRKHATAMRAFACAASRSPRGRAFARASRRLDMAPLDGCAEEPITLVASASVTLGAQFGPDAWMRMRDLSLGLTHQVQERLDEAGEAAQSALELARANAPEAVPEIRTILARIAGRQGRLEAALSWLAEGEHGPAVDSTAAWRVRGEAYAQVWRWSEAAQAYRRVAEEAPGDALAWRDYARALGSAGDDAGALVAARRGLELGPRNPDLLRSQSLALSEDVAAREAFLAHRIPDERQALLRRCQEEVPGCDRDRQPVPRIAMRAR